MPDSLTITLRTMKFRKIKQEKAPLPPPKKLLTVAAAVTGLRGQTTPNVQGCNLLE